MTEQPIMHDFRNTICGPFDSQFRKKFLGRQSISLSVIKQKIIKAHEAQTKQFRAYSQQNLLPKIKQIEKITKESKTGKKKKVKLNQYVDGVSDLQLYIAKKLINQTSTQQIMAKLQRESSTHDHLTITDNKNSRKSSQSFAKTDNKFHKINPLMDNDLNFIKTSYNSQRKWVTDRQYNKKFDKFIIVRSDSETYSMKKAFGDQKVQSKDQIVDRLAYDRNVLKNIVQKMIHEHNYQTQFQVQQNIKVPKKQLNPQNKQDRNNISWILKSCEELQKKFNIKKKKNKNTTKKKQAL